MSWPNASLLLFLQLLTQKDYNILNKVIREKRNPQSSRFIQEAIDIEAKVVYFQNTVTVILKGKLIFEFPGVDSFHTFNEFDGVQSFYGNVLRNETVTLRGFGQ